MIEKMVIATIAFVLGTAFGYGLCSLQRSKKKLPMSIQKIIALMIAVVWCGSVASEVFYPGYTTGVWVHTIMGGVAGYLFAKDRIPIKNG
jgi:hypothetical protein